MTILFEKGYTRDTSFIIQQTWNDDIAHGLEEFSGKNPHSPAVVDYMHQGATEIWLNKKAFDWYQENIRLINETRPEQFEHVKNNYKKNLEKCMSYWAEKYLSDIAAFKKYIHLLEETMNLYNFIYYSAIDDRNPAAIHKQAVELRETDEFFEQNVRFASASLVALHPQVKGFETTILKEEIENPPENSILEQRKKHFVFIPGTRGKITPLKDYAQNHHEFHFQFETDNPESAATGLRGQVAFPGIAQGPVRILRTKDQVKEMEEGAVIVSAMTTPDFLPAMKKASAFVTEEGGITCHAAIIARELKKPCVIGTKIATKTFKDGDIIQVDAEKGIVKKI
jgi:phosphohistidine swiveling domain-containing protein